MSVRFVKQMREAAFRARPLVLLQERWAPMERVTADELLDMRVALDAAHVMGHEIARLRRLVRKHGGRP